MLSMAEHTGPGPQPVITAARPAPAASTTRVRSSSFKYYIHDSIGALRLKLIGELTQADLTELSGCWRTARTTLGGRKLILDLEALRTVDEAGKQWLAGMSAEGAVYLPENYLVTCIAGQHAFAAESEPAAAKTGFLKRVASWFRSERVSTSRSPKQAQ
jgi:hypothetical protein